MTSPDPTWLDAQYNNRARIPDHPRIFENWQAASTLAREQSPCVLDLPYGDGPHETLDLFTAPQAGAPVLVFIHGGYWRALDKSDHSFVAPSFVADGAIVVVPNYALCPVVTMETIALQMTQAMAWVHRHAAAYGGDSTRIVVAGHSAGGHLSAMLLACDGRAVGADLPQRLTTRALSISGLFDLEPLRHTPFLQEDLRLTPASVQRLSPARFPAPLGSTLMTTVGALESEEFLRQNALIRERWGPDVVPVCETIPDCHHLNVLHELADPQGRLHALALQLLDIR